MATILLRDRCRKRKWERISVKEMSEHLKEASIARALGRKANEVCHLHEKVLMLEEEVVLETSYFIILE